MQQRAVVFMPAIVPRVGLSILNKCAAAGERSRSAPGGRH
jgi:hypothetical protein